MNMNLIELIDWLTDLRKIAKDETNTNVASVELEGETAIEHTNDYNNSWRRESAKKVRVLNIKLKLRQTDIPQSSPAEFDYAIRS